MVDMASYAFLYIRTAVTYEDIIDSAVGGGCGGGCEGCSVTRGMRRMCHWIIYVLQKSGMRAQPQ